MASLWIPGSPGNRETNPDFPMLTIKLEKDEVTPHLRRLLKQAEPGSPLFRVLGRATANELKKHFRARNSKQPNKLGGRRTNFWSRVAESVHAPKHSAREILVPVNHPAIAQKVFGGTITPRKAKNLAIPIHPQAHGKSPRIIPGLFFWRSARGTRGLGIKGSGGELVPLYVLKPSVTQSADREALPQGRQISDALTKAADIHLRRRV